eukprot:11752780-Alexandrium_andersonii.AAC.1
MSGARVAHVCALGSSGPRTPLSANGGWAQPAVCGAPSAAGGAAAFAQAQRWGKGSLLQCPALLRG